MKGIIIVNLITAFSLILSTKTSAADAEQGKALILITKLGFREECL